MYLETISLRAVGANQEKRERFFVEGGQEITYDGVASPHGAVFKFSQAKFGLLSPSGQRHEWQGTGKAGLSPRATPCRESGIIVADTSGEWEAYVISEGGYTSATLDITYTTIAPIGVIQPPVQPAPPPAPPAQTIPGISLVSAVTPAANASSNTQKKTTVLWILLPAATAAYLMWRRR